MEKDVKYTGDWFLPKQKENKCKGILIFNVDEGIRLEVYGSLNGQPRYKGDEESKVIFGILSNGELVSIYDTFVISATNSIYTKSGSEAIYRVNYCFVGSHIIEPKIALVSKIRFNVFNMEEWFGHLGFHIERQLNNEIYKLNMQYSTPNDISFDVNTDIQCVIRFGFVNTNWTEKGVELKSAITFEISNCLGSPLEATSENAG